MQCTERRVSSRAKVAVVATLVCSAVGVASGAASYEASPEGDDQKATTGWSDLRAMTQKLQHQPEEQLPDGTTVGFVALKNLRWRGLGLPMIMAQPGALALVARAANQAVFMVKASKLEEFIRKNERHGSLGLGGRLEVSPIIASPNGPQRLEGFWTVGPLALVEWVGAAKGKDGRDQWRIRPERLGEMNDHQIRRERIDAFNHGYNAERTQRCTLTPDILFLPHFAPTMWQHAVSAGLRGVRRLANGARAHLGGRTGCSSSGQ